MLLRRTRLPGEGELVLCTVTTIHYNSVFARLEEFSKQGMIHISEVSPGRIRNIRDYVAEGKVIICKVLKVDKERGHIDLSLRRVSEGQRRAKASELKQEQRAEKIIEILAKQLKLDPKKVYEELSKPIFEEYEYIFHAFEGVSKDEIDIDNLHVPKTYQKALLTIIKDKIRAKIIEITGTATLKTFETAGVEHIKHVLSDAEKKYKTDIRYIGGGKYTLKLEGPEYKEVEKTLKSFQSFLEAACKKQHIDYSFARKE